MEYQNYKALLSDFTVNSNGLDGGHYYVVSTIELFGKTRRVSVFFKDKIEEAKLKSKFNNINIEGLLKDDGNEDVFITDAFIIE